MIRSPCSVSHGSTYSISPYSDEIEYVEPWLTLHGLRIIFERNVGSG